MEPGRPSELTPDELSYRCSPELFSFTTTAEFDAGSGTIGQERGVASLEFGLAVRNAGFNIYIAGMPGTGRNTTTLNLIRNRATNEPVPSDWCYVYNFADPSRPTAISLRAGQGRAFAAEMHDLIATCQHEIPRAFESVDYAQRRTAIAQQLQAARESSLGELNTLAKQLGFAIDAGASGIVSVPVEQGRPLTREEFDALPEARRTEFQQNHLRLQPLISQLLVQNRRLEKTAGEQLRSLDRDTGNFVLAPLLVELRERHADQPRVLSYLDQVQNELLQNVDIFQTPVPEAGAGSPAVSSSASDPFSRYGVNVVVDNADLDGAPIVVEHNPTYYNLFGRSDYAIRQGVPTTDYTMIRAGAVHRANGGYLVLQARDLMSAPFAWDGLKRTLRSRAVQPENLGDQYSAVPTVTLRPEPIPIDLKVVLIGDSMAYRTLQAHDEDFQKHFKVRADFDVTMPRTADNEVAFATFIARRCQHNGLRHFDRTAVASIVDFGARLAGHREKLTSRFVDIANLVDEASHWADAAAAEVVRVEHVTRAIEEKVYRSRMVEEKIQEYLTDGTILMEIDGDVVGQVNGLSVLDLGDYAFGRPSRITARVGPGNRGIVNVERETKRSGPAHSKGVLTLAGYLLGQYGQDRPLNLTASIGFEQMYEEVDGDSASSTELYAVLSALANLPIRQGVAVTGSVNQRGQVQAIGGVNEKIEGFFAVCRAIGLTGNQGVAIPRSNVPHLLLRDDVIAAVREGAFHIWAVSTIDQGIELLTGVSAGAANEGESFPADSVHGRVATRLATFLERNRGRDSSP